jgi:CDP-diacylglycerol pyrophosphatase
MIKRGSLIEKQKIKGLLYAEVSLFQSVEITDFLPALKRSRVPFSKRFIVPLIDSELHLAYEGQSGGTENHPHIHFSCP